MKKRLLITLCALSALSACAVSEKPKTSEAPTIAEQTRNHYIGSSFIGKVKEVKGGEILLEGKRGSLVRVKVNPLESPFSVGETAVFVTPDNPYIHTGKSELIKWHLWQEKRDRIFAEPPKEAVEKMKLKETSVFK